MAIDPEFSRTQTHFHEILKKEIPVAFDAIQRYSKSHITLNCITFKKKRIIIKPFFHYIEKVLYLSSSNLDRLRLSGIYFYGGLNFKLLGLRLAKVPSTRASFY